MQNLVKKTSFLLIFLLYSVSLINAQSTKPKLTVDFIMRDSKWMGTSPDNIYWSDDGSKIYFDWNPENAPGDSLYVVSIDGGNPKKVSITERKKLPAPGGDYSNDRTKKVYQKNGDLFLFNTNTGKIQQLTNTVDSESNPEFNLKENKVIFERDNNLYTLDLQNGITTQITNFKSGDEPSDKKLSEREEWLKNEEMKLIKTLKERKEKRELAEKVAENEQPERPLEIYTGKKRINSLELSPDEKYATFELIKGSDNENPTKVPNYVTESGYVEEMQARPKVGSEQATYEFGIYNIPEDTVIYFSTDDLAGIHNKPVFTEEEKDTIDNNWKKEVIYHGPFYSDDGQNGFLVVRSLDNKDRWIVLLDFKTGEYTVLDHQHDDAWIAGPGIAWYIYGAGNVGWLPDNKTVWFQSEATGYSHLYTVNINTGEKNQLTHGKYEVFNPQVSRDGKYWYFTSSEVHPGERQFYKMPIDGGDAERITTMTGNNRVILSPDETKLAIRYSYSNKPWELYLMDNKPGAAVKQITHSQSDEFKSYPWRDPQIITFTADDGAKVYARLYRSDNPQPRGPAVIFVHGAGYLQNVHKWWSSYFREFMFNNLLVENGYTVLDIDYRGSAGYGRDWRTAIYRHMGSKDLSDQVDGAKYLIENYKIDPQRIGIYGGSYGGFITLMAMFKDPGVFKAGAALRSVTDWAHYNHPYTSNILNEPQNDSLAFVQSSPIYFAEGLEGHLLMCHGVLDDNVQFQDIVRLTQRLIELGKDNWELAVYPLERHGFVEPSSWTDEYKRIFKLFEDNLK